MKENRGDKEVIRQVMNGWMGEGEKNKRHTHMAGSRVWPHETLNFLLLSAVKLPLFIP